MIVLRMGDYLYLFSPPDGICLIMARKTLLSIVALVVAPALLVTRVAAEDGGGLGGDFGDALSGLGIAGGVLLGLSVLHGLFMFVSQQRPVAAAFKKANFKAFKVWKLHHLFTLPTLAVFVIHAIVAYSNGYYGASSSFVVFSWTGTVLMGFVCVAGAFFPKARGKWRAALRIVHFSLIVAVIVTMAIHVVVCD
jgi:hypothetical protein